MTQEDSRPANAAHVVPGVLLGLIITWLCVWFVELSGYGMMVWLMAVMFIGLPALGLVIVISLVEGLKRTSLSPEAWCWLWLPGIVAAVLGQTYVQASW